jgi:hypothetical protein
MRNFVFSIVVLVLSLISSYSDAYQGKKVYNFLTNCAVTHGNFDNFVSYGSSSFGISRFVSNGTHAIACNLPNDYTADNSSLNWQWHQDNIDSVLFNYETSVAPASFTVFVAICESKNDLSPTECGTWKQITGTYGTITLYRTSDFPDLTNSHGAPLLIIRTWGVTSPITIYLSNYIVTKTI